ncbi:MAG: hypothetical protein ACO4CG_03305 [Prochlorothrix sp.]
MAILGLRRLTQPFPHSPRSIPLSEGKSAPSILGEPLGEPLGKNLGKNLGEAVGKNRPSNTADRSVLETQLPRP